MLNRQATGTDSPQNAEPWTLHSRSLRLLSPSRDILSLTRSECSLLENLSDAAAVCSYEELIDAMGSGGLQIGRAHV